MRRLPGYGASPVHLLGHLAAVGVAAYAVSRVLDVPSTDGVRLLVWLVGGALLHDAVLLPAYALGDVVVRVLIADHPLRRVRAANHLRVPAAVSGAMLLVYAPSILGLGDEAFARVSGRAPAVDPLRAWLLITLGAFVLSGLVLAARGARAARGRGSRGRP